MIDDGAVFSMRVQRPPASAVWTHEHRWGTLISDVTNLRVTRTAKGSLRISYGKDSIEVRESLVAIVALMISEAAAWTDDDEADS